MLTHSTPGYGWVNKRFKLYLISIVRCGCRENKEVGLHDLFIGCQHAGDIRREPLIWVVYLSSPLTQLASKRLYGMILFFLPPCKSCDHGCRAFACEMSEIVAIGPSVVVLKSSFPTLRMCHFNHIVCNSLLHT